MNLLLGASGEFYAHQEFEKCGYRVSYPTEKKQGDMRVFDPVTGEVLRVEVKTARKGRNLNYQVCLKKAKKTDVAHAELVVVQLVEGTGRVISYFIPSWALAGKQGISFRYAESMRSKWAQYRKPNYRVFGGASA